MSDMLACVLDSISMGRVLGPLADSSDNSFVVMGIAGVTELSSLVLTMNSVTEALGTSTDVREMCS